jgi:hypothetical protein
MRGRTWRRPAWASVDRAMFNIVSILFAIATATP